MQSKTLVDIDGKKMKLPNNYANCQVFVKYFIDFLEGNGEIYLSVSHQALNYNIFQNQLNIYRRGYKEEYSSNEINSENQYKLLFPKNKPGLIIMCPQPKVQFFLAPTRPCQDRQKVVILLGNRSQEISQDIIKKVLSKIILELKEKKKTTLCVDYTLVNLIYYIEYSDYKKLDTIKSLIVKSIAFNDNIEFSRDISGTFLYNPGKFVDIQSPPELVDGEEEDGARDQAREPVVLSTMQRELNSSIGPAWTSEANGYNLLSEHQLLRSGDEEEDGSSGDEANLDEGYQGEGYQGAEEKKSQTELSEKAQKALTQKALETGEIDI